MDKYDSFTMVLADMIDTWLFTALVMGVLALWSSCGVFLRNRGTTGLLQAPWQSSLYRWLALMLSIALGSSSLSTCCIIFLDICCFGVTDLDRQRTRELIVHEFPAGRSDHLGTALYRGRIFCGIGLMGLMLFPDTRSRMFTAFRATAIGLGQLSLP